MAVVQSAALLAQQNTPAAKQAEATKNQAVTAPNLPSTAKLWRLVSKAQALRIQLEQSEAGKAAKAAEDELQAEQSRLATMCGPSFVLGYDQISTSPTFQDLICQSKPPEQAAIKPDQSKGK